jgi:hypothetical protein
MDDGCLPPEDEHSEQHIHAATRDFHQQEGRRTTEDEDELLSNPDDENEDKEDEAWTRSWKEEMTAAKADMEKEKQRQRAVAQWMDREDETSRTSGSEDPPQGDTQSLASTVHG